MIYKYNCSIGNASKSGSVTSNGTRDDAIQNVYAIHPDASNVRVQGENKQESPRKLAKV